MIVYGKTVDGITRFRTFREASDFACDDDWIESVDDDWQVVTRTSMRGQELKDRFGGHHLDMSPPTVI